ncbi:transmembrane protein 44 isoform X2 [Rhinatrema bivittatum]|uniref:transmembrane protein 44 isoform X2 n=1 Tax=Rhinatrema bivittatum TaxID=194408 RepID=UPI001128F748|nr:transmembrane protein 44 isoform X2 [Rhinatrema bivittatum]
MVAIGNETHTGGALWNWDYLINCFAEEKICISFGLWIIASLFWITTHALLFFLRYRKKWRQQESVSWIIYCFVGSMCNTIGALLSKQLTIQVFTGGYMAAIDVINFILTLFPACGFRLKYKSGHYRARRRRKYRTSLFALALPVSVGIGCYFTTASALPVSEEHQGPRRRLLGMVLQENTEVMGFSLGMVAVVISWTARCPLITRVWRGKMFPVMQLWAYFFSVLASVFYAAAVMAHDRQVDYYVRATPWFLIVLGSAALDVAIIILSCMMKSRLMQQLGLVVKTEDIPDAHLLAHEEEETEEEEEYGDKHQGTEEGKSWTPLNMVPHPRSLHKTAEIGRYLELSIEQVQEWDFEDLNNPLMEGSAEMSNIHPNDSSVLSASSMSDANAIERPPGFGFQDQDSSLAGQTSAEGIPGSAEQTHSLED